MKQLAHGWIKFNYIFMYIVSFIIGLVSLGLIMVGMFTMSSQNPDNEGLVLVFMGIYFMIYLGFTITSVVLAKLALNSMDTNTMQIKWGVLSIIFGAIPVGGILYIIAVSREQNSNTI